MAALVLEYYLLLRSVLRSKPQLRACLTRCRHCRIFFLTHPRNGGRHNLRCPFGCREAHRKQQSTRRSVDYYRDSQGKTKKSALNHQRRSRVGPAPPLKTAAAQAPEPGGPAAGWNAPIVAHVRLVSSLIEGRPVSRKEILAMLARVLRQHTIGRRTPIDHALAWLNEHAP